MQDEAPSLVYLWDIGKMVKDMFFLLADCKTYNIDAPISWSFIHDFAWNHHYHDAYHQSVVIAAHAFMLVL